MLEISLELVIIKLKIMLKRIWYPREEDYFKIFCAAALNFSRAS